MVWINIWDRILCRFVRRLVTSSAARAMPHVIFGAVLTCGPVIHYPSVPREHVPPQFIPTKPLLRVPSTEQPRWTFIPEMRIPAFTPDTGLGIPNEDIIDVGTVYPIALDSNNWHVSGDDFHVITDDDKPQHHKVEEPGTLAWFMLALVILFIWKALPLQAGAAQRKR